MRSCFVFYEGIVTDQKWNQNYLPNALPSHPDLFGNLPFDSIFLTHNYYNLRIIYVGDI
jgi:hypothetical protein